MSSSVDEMRWPADRQVLPALIVMFLAAVLTLVRAGEVAAQPFAYVTTSPQQYSGGHTFEPGAVVVIDTATRRLVGPPIPVGHTPYGIAVAPDGTRAYVTNEDDDTVTVIDTIQNAPIGAPIPVGHTPNGIAITPDGSRVYTTNEYAGTVSVIDTATNAVVRSIGQVIGSGYASWPNADIGITPDGTRVYVAGNQTVSVIDVATNRVGGFINCPSFDSYCPGSFFPTAFAFTHDGRRAYVAGPQDGIWLIDVLSDELITGVVFQSMRSASPVAITPDDQRLYGISLIPTVKDEVGFQGAVVAISTVTNEMVSEPIAVGTQPWSLAITPSGRYVYVANEYSAHSRGSVSVIDTVTNTVVDTLEVYGYAYAVAIGPALPTPTPTGTPTPTSTPVGMNSGSGCGVAPVHSADFGSLVQLAIPVLLLFGRQRSMIGQIVKAIRSRDA